MLPLPVLILLILFTILTAYFFTSAIYTFIVSYKQTKYFINNLKIGDETSSGTVDGFEGDYVIVKAKIHRTYIHPATYKNIIKVLFMFSK